MLDIDMGGSFASATGEGLILQKGEAAMAVVMCRSSCWTVICDAVKLTYKIANVGVLNLHFMKLYENRRPKLRRI